MKREYYKRQRRWNASLAFNAGLVLCYFLLGCAGSGKRPHYDRDTGGYREAGRHQEMAKEKKPPQQVTVPKTAPEKTETTEAVKTLRQVADSYLGVPYKWGGENRNGMDCSGFVRRVFRETYDLQLPRKSGKIARRGTPISLSELEQGDLVFFGKWTGIDHVGIYMEDGQFIHASTSLGVVYSPMDSEYYQKRYKGARRLARR